MSNTDAQTMLSQLNVGSFLQFHATLPQENNDKSSDKQKSELQTNPQSTIQQTQNSSDITFQKTPTDELQEQCWLRPPEAINNNPCSKDGANFCRSQGDDDCRKYNKSILKRPRRAKQQVTRKQVHWGTNTICELKRSSNSEEKLRNRSNSQETKKIKMPKLSLPQQNIPIVLKERSATDLDNCRCAIF